jgi:hypothetical protein
MRENAVQLEEFTVSLSTCIISPTPSSYGGGGGGRGSIFLIVSTTPSYSGPLFTDEFSHSIAFRKRDKFNLTTISNC